MNSFACMTQKRLFELQDLSYREFQSGLMPGVPKENIIGVRMPALRRLCKELSEKSEAKSFLEELPHRYYEENNLHMLMLSNMSDYGECIEHLRSFLPYVDNWATCDIAAPRCLEAHKEQLLADIDIWLASDHPYTVRYAIGLLMRFYLDEDFKSEYAERVVRVSSDEYYIKMMTAWYLATALAKQWDAVIPYLEQRRLSPWIHRKTIQKAVESYRIGDEQKTYLKSLRRGV